MNAIAEVGAVLDAAQRGMAPPDVIVCRHGERFERFGPALGRPSDGMEYQVVGWPIRTNPL